MNLIGILDYINLESLITLYLNNNLVAMDVPIFSFPDRHDINIYSNNEVLEIKAISKDRFAVYLKNSED